METLSIELQVKAHVTITRKIECAITREQIKQVKTIFLIILKLYFIHSNSNANLIFALLMIIPIDLFIFDLFN